MAQSRKGRKPVIWTDRVVQQLGRPTRGRADYSDPSTKGLYLTVTARDTRTWRHFYRLEAGGKVEQRRDALGHYPDMTLADARARVQERHKLVRAGKDPRRVEREAEAAERKAVQDEADNTFAQGREDYLAKCEADGLRTVDERRRHFKKYVPADWADRQLSAIDRKDVVTLWSDIEEHHGPVMANRVIETLRGMYRWLGAEGRATDNPALNVRRKRVEKDRDRVLSDKELAAVWKASDSLGEPWRAFIRTLILTGQRRNEVATMKWSDLDLDEAAWNMPRETSKMDRAHGVPLSKQAVEVLARLPRHVEGSFVFTTSHGRKPVAAFSQVKAKLDEYIKHLDGADVDAWRVHDLRRTMASGMARLGVPPHVTEKVLGHESGVISGVSAVYNRFDYGDEKRDALDRWGQHVATITDESGKVVALPQRA